ncbi:MAG: endolytic transglycosylase MltG [Methylohalobius sp. ZOD2]
MKTLLVGLIVIVVAVLGTAGWGVSQYRSALKKPLANAETVVVEIHKGESLKSVAQRFEAQGLLEEKLWLYLLALQQGVSGDIKAGEYEIQPGTTLKGLLDLLVSGKVKQHKLTLIEGWTVKEMLIAMRSTPALQTTLEGISEENLLAELGVPPGHPEGRFFPDTYFFVRGTTDRKILRRAYRRMEQVLDEEWQRRAPDLLLKTPTEALILASIVEKETALRDEQAKIAGVFIRRLQKDMLLQSDPTIIYGMGDAFDGDIRYRDLRADTPYNTYVRSGLPPTPIALPGRDSIHAVLHPEEGDELYFVAKGDGSHVFSATLKAHNRAVARYQKHP